MSLIARRLFIALTAATAIASALPLNAQTFPARPVRIIVPFPAGGPSDLLTRMMAPKLTDLWGQQITVDNRPGAGTIIGTDLGAKAAPDGYTIALVSTGHATNPGLHSKLPYDTLADFAPVTLGTTLPMIIVAHPSFAAHSFKDFIALAKARPGEIGFATSGNGTTGHLGGELLKSVAHINLIHIPYKGSAPAIADVLGGQVATTFDGLPAALPHVQAGKLNALAVMSTERSPLLPNVVTIAESGFPGFSADSWFGFVVPAKTPPAIVKQLNADMVKVVKLPEIRDRLIAMGYRPIANTPEEFDAFIRAELAKWAKVIKDWGQGWIDMREDARDTAGRVNEQRLWQRHAEMAKIGAIPGNGVNRAALSKEDIAARKLLLSWVAKRKFTVSVDGIGNLFVRRAGNDANAAPIMTGSHMDSQPRGGRFDGIYGVLAGLEALEAMDEAGVTTRRPVEVVAWTNEEGGRFAPCTMGSMIYTGARPLADVLDVTDNEGIKLRDALAQTLAATPEAAKREFDAPAAGYIEAHIEQGPLLENARKTIGVVTGIQGLRWFNVEVSGKTDHAGTTPLALRRDAVRDAIAIINALAELTHDPLDVTRFTVGRMLVTPNSPNSVASHVLFSVDIRHPDPHTVARLGDAVEPLARKAAQFCDVKVTPTLHDDPCVFDAQVAGAIEDAAQTLGLPHMRLPSGASHDAMYMARVCPTGMIFVPCEKGISHNEAENASPADLAAGARVLTAALIELANR